MFLSLVAAMVAATATYAQSSMLATLSHDGEISAFYGASALREAHNAATHGDIITLSSGSFNSVDITKGVTIRGAGCSLDRETTIIIGDFSIAIPNDKRLIMEGIYHNHTITLKDYWLVNPTFLKCRLNRLKHNISATMNLTMINCQVASEMDICYNSSASFVNCILMNSYVGVNGNYEFYNCIISNANCRNSILKNCILSVTGNDYSLESNNIAQNCVAVGNATKIFKNIPNTTNMIKTYEEVFKTYTGNYTDNESFELTEEAKTTLLGSDGTQVGIYGGNMPYDPTPSIPQISKCNVAAKSTADGKLSVDITVQGAE